MPPLLALLPEVLLRPRYSVVKERSHLKHRGTWFKLVGAVVSNYIFRGIQGENRQTLTRVQRSDPSGWTHTRWPVDLAQTRAV